MSDVNEMSDPRSGTAGPPEVEENGYWFGVFLFVFVVVFGTAFAALIHALAATFGG